MTTIKDIAIEANVSIGTVSRALNGEKGMRSETRERILSIAQRLNYYPNLQARGLVVKQPNAIGIVIPQTPEFALTNPYYTEILKGVEEKARQEGQYLVLSFSRDESYARIYQSRLAGGIIVLANRINDHWVDEVYDLKIPLVLIPGTPNRKLIPSVDLDNVDGSIQAVTHLFALGHRRIGLLNGPANSKYSMDRLLGYQQAMKKFELPIQKELIQESDFSLQSGYDGIKKILVTGNPPTAVLMINDYSAIGALQAAKEMGFRVPEDISIIGSGDIPFANAIEPPLTTIHAPYHAQGQRAVEMLLRIMQGKRLSRKHQTLSVELVIRKSTSPPTR